MGDLAVENTGKAYSGINEIQDEIQVVEFILGDDIFAINLFDVKEIVEYTRIMPLPGREQFIKGIIDLRGEITTIIDLKEKMGILMHGAFSHISLRLFS